MKPLFHIAALDSHGVWTVYYYQSSADIKNLTKTHRKIHILETC